MHPDDWDMVVRFIEWAPYYVIRGLLHWWAGLTLGFLASVLAEYVNAWFRGEL